MKKEVKVAKAEEVVPPIVKKDNQRTASLREMYSLADGYDYVCLFFGIIGSAATGCAMPIVMVLMGQMLDNLNTEHSTLQDLVNQTCIYYVIVGSGTVFFSIVQMTSLTFVGERNAHRLRSKYVKAILSQEIGWFDTIGAAELSTKVADHCGKLQDGMGNKLGDLIQATFQFICGLGASFYECWQLTLVLLAGIPIIAFAGVLMVRAFTEAQNETSDQYASAGGLATEQLSAIRTVTALNAQVMKGMKHMDYFM